MAKKEVKPATPLAQRMRQVRKELGDKERKEFAKQLGIPANSLGNYERGESVPTATVLQKYRDELSVNMNWLLSGNGMIFDYSDNALTDKVKTKLDMKSQYVQLAIIRNMEIMRKNHITIEPDGFWYTVSLFNEIMLDIFEGDDIPEDEIEDYLVKYIDNSMRAAGLIVK